RDRRLGHGEFLVDLEIERDAANRRASDPALGHGNAEHRDGLGRHAAAVDGLDDHTGLEALMLPQKHAAEFRRCLEQLDVAGIRKLWRHVSPNMPQPKNDAEALISLHSARTQSEAMPIKLRAWSHRWLLDNGLPSQLPD